jgi:Fic family protein
MHNLEADTRAWLADTTSGRYGDDECALRFGYRLVAIRPFPNGNGRWSRLASDALVLALGRPRFTWGRNSLVEPSALRRNYIAALQIADTDRDIGALIEFARS